MKPIHIEGIYSGLFECFSKNGFVVLGQAEKIVEKGQKPAWVPIFFPVSHNIFKSLHFQSHEKRRLCYKDLTLYQTTKF